MIGAVNRNFSGSAYVFVRNGNGNWSQQAKLTADDGDADDLFGDSVSIAGDTAVVGARLDDDNGSYSGSAYVFVRDGIGNWSRQAKLTAEDGTGGVEFGRSVSIAGDTAVIGVWGDDENGSGSGSAYVFVRDVSGNWSQQAKLTADDGAAGDWFGISVSITEDTAVIGAINNDDKGSNSGSAYLFVRNGSGNWSQQAKLTAGDGATNDSFGNFVSISRDTAVIGALFDDDNGSNSGSVYIFDLNSLTPNSEPIAENDTAGPIENAGSLDINVLTNDDDSDGSLDVSSVTKVTEPTNGTAAVDPILLT